MMPLTDEERRVAAERAERYPSGHGGVWGTGKLNVFDTGTAARRIELRPALAEVG
jgi:hypothetical protein